MWTSTPCRALPAECLCLKRSNMMSHGSISSHLSLQQEPKSAPDHASTEPLQPLCTCLIGGGALYQQHLSSVGCLCDVQHQMMHSTCCEPYPGKTCRKLSSLSAPFTAPSASHRAVIGGNTDFQSLRCRRALFVQNLGSGINVQPSHHLLTAEAGVPTCDCDRRLRYVASCTCKQEHPPSVFVNHKCVCDDLMRNEAKKNPSACVNASSCDTVPHCEGVPNTQLVTDSDESVDVFKWQHQHMQYLAVQKSDILGISPKLEFSSGVHDAGGDSTVHCYKDGCRISPESRELVEVLTNQIAELQAELKQERTKVKLLESLFKQTQEELDSLRTLHCTQQNDSGIASIDMQSYCLTNRRDHIDSDDVSASQASDESAIEDVLLHETFKCSSNNLDSTDEGVSSEQHSMERSSYLQEMPIVPTLSRNNCNVHSLRKVLKELSSCYDELLETNLTMRTQLKASSKRTQRGGKEKLLFKELHGSYATLRTVVEICNSLLNDTQLQPPIEPSMQPVDSNLTLRDVSALRRSVEELHRSARERLFTTRFKPTV